jgi:hypothetical protein
MPNPNHSLESSALAHITAVVHLILIVLRLATQVLEKSAEILDLAMQPVASFPTNSDSEEVGAQGPDTSNTNHGENVSVDITPPNSEFSAVGDMSTSPAAEVRDDTTCRCIGHPPVPIFCNPSTRSRRFYVVTVGRQVGVFDNR